MSFGKACVSISVLKDGYMMSIQLSGRGYFLITNGYMYNFIFKCANSCRNDVSEQVI